MAARLVPRRPPSKRWAGSLHGVHAVSSGIERLGGWSNVRGTAVDENEVSDLVTKIKAAMPADVQEKSIGMSPPLQHDNYEL